MIDFTNIRLGEINVFFECMISIQDKRPEYVKTVYQRRAQHYDDVLELLASLKLVNLSQPKLSITRKSKKFVSNTKVNKSKLKIELIDNLTKSRTDISTYANHYLQLFEKDKKYFIYKPILSENIKYSCIRNLFTELGVVKYNSEKSYYYLTKSYDHLSQKHIKKKVFTPRQLRQLNEDNEKIGLLAEKEIMKYEKNRLSGYQSYVKKIKHIALTNVSAGYDISSFEIPKNNVSAEARYIEVKAVSIDSYQFYWYC